MDTPELLSFLDLIDLDESMIDAPLNYLMGRASYTNRHLKNAIMLLQYKMLINTQEGTECENENEFNFVVKLLREMGEDNIEYVCKIVNLVIGLTPSKMVSKAEHLLQQLLPEIQFRTGTPVSSAAERLSYKKKLLVLKATDSVLNAVLKKGEQLSLMFLETPLERILDCQDEKLKAYFLTKTVPKLLEGVVGYNILDRMWLYVQYLKDDRREIALRVLSCLSDYYLPPPDENGGSVYATELIFQYNFWDILLFGLSSDDAAVRKTSVYLTKRAIDCVVAAKRDFNVRSRKYEIIFEWTYLNSKSLKNMWDNFFILLDSLEEKQSNIVLPSLKLFEGLIIGDCWLNCAFKLGLTHDNTQVRIKCIEYKLNTKIKSEAEAQILLEALNDINIYDKNMNYDAIKAQVMELLKDRGSLIAISKSMPLIKWSPIPLYHLTSILADLSIDMPAKYGSNDICTIVIEMIKIICNNIIISRAVQINILNFVKYCCKNLSWKDVIKIYSHLNNETFLQDVKKAHPMVAIVKQVIITEEDKTAYLKLLAENYKDIDLIILFLSNNEDHVSLFIDVINENINKLHECVNRQYSDKTEYLKNVVFLIHFQSKSKDITFLQDVYQIIARENKTILQYILGLFSNEANLTLEDAVALLKKDDFELGADLQEILLQLYITSVLVLKNDPEIDTAVLSIFTIKMLTKNPALNENNKHEMLNMKQFLEIVKSLNFLDTYNASVGRSKNAIYEKSCEILFWYVLEGEDIHTCLPETIEFIENVLECGGYNCLRWILKMVNYLIDPLIDDKSNFNMTKFIIRAWNEIEELKSNNQYSPCIEEFVKLITQDCLLRKSMYNNVIILYCNRIIEYGPVKTNPLYYLIRSLNEKDLKLYGHLIYVLCEILLYCPVPRKDQRITDNVILEIMQSPKYGINKESIETHFNYEIQYLATSTLCKIDDLETLRMITNFITIRIDNTFKNKQRYHGNSQMHRILNTTLQHILALVLKSGDLEHLFQWCLDLLVKLPHQPSVRICIEWFVTLYFYIQKINIGDQILDTLKSKNVPLLSQFYILYWLLKRKISTNTYTDNEYEYVLDFLLSHTMGQLFNVRLNAQYLATKLYKLAQKQKYEYTINIIEKTFAECENDKNFVKLKSDYFTNQFDIVANLTPFFIYHVLPRYCEIENNETVDFYFVKNIIKDINESLIKEGNDNNDLITEWKCSRKSDDDFVDLNRNKESTKVLEDSEPMTTLQKKYIPWKNMSDVNVYDVGKKRESSSELIVVASLIDKLPNLGGMARTSEVFGVQTLVVDSLRHLQDKQFQGLSVSAERWINVEEVRPGRPLKDYLIKKKEEGYTVVAAEQTSTSVKLQNFKFPKKTLLLLGHEKEGVPCDLLPIMDNCVEIPQQGYVRSLNVHVTAAIFVWEYARQNVV